MPLFYLVHQRGLTSNRIGAFIEVLQGMGKLFKCSDLQTGRNFQWEPLAVAA
jgi:hypothetical protein